MCRRAVKQKSNQTKPLKKKPWLHQNLCMFVEYLRRDMKKNQQNGCAPAPAKTQISLGIRTVWSESSMSAWRNLGSLAAHWTHSEDSDKTESLLGAHSFCWFCHDAAHYTLNHLCLVSHFWNLGKQCRPRPDAQVLHCLLTGTSIRIKIKMNPEDHWIAESWGYVKISGHGWKEALG